MHGKHDLNVKKDHKYVSSEYPEVHSCQISPVERQCSIASKTMGYSAGETQFESCLCCQLAV